MSTTQQSVADSATPRARKAARSPAEVDLDRRTAMILKRAMKPRDGDSAVDRELADHLAQIEIRSLFSARRLDDGKPEFQTIETYVKHLIKVARGELRASKTPCIKTGYKLINEAFVYNRLLPQITVQPPTRRAQVQVLEDCAAENRAKIWTQTVADAKDRKITSKMVADAARAHGEDIPVPTPSNSEKHSKAASLYQLLRSAFEKGARDAGKVGEFEEFDKCMSKASTSSISASSIPVTSSTTKDGAPLLEDATSAEGPVLTEGEPFANSPVILAAPDNPRDSPFIVAGDVKTILSAKRPWVTTFAGKVLVAFNQNSQMGDWVRAGFPSLKPQYEFKGYKFNKVWEHTENLSPEQQAAEVARVAQCLAETAPKMPPEISAPSSTAPLEL